MRAPRARSAPEPRNHEPELEPELEQEPEPGTWNLNPPMLSFPAPYSFQEASNALQICPVVRRRLRNVGIRRSAPAGSGTGQFSARHERLRVYPQGRERL